MKISNYKATLVGLITTAICLAIYAGAFLVPAFLFFPVFFSVSSIPFYFLGDRMFGETNYFGIESTVLVCEFILLLILCRIYFRKLIRDEKQKEPFNTTRLVVFFVFLQFIVHPIVFYGSLVYDGVPIGFLFFLNCIITFPISGCAFVVFGIIIDLIRNQIRKSNSLS